MMPACILAMARGCTSFAAALHLGTQEGPMWREQENTCLEMIDGGTPAKVSNLPWTMKIDFLE